MKPLNIEDLSQSEDCFGRAWDPQHRACSVCADVDICGVVFQEKVVIPKTKKFDESLPLDLLDFSKVDWDNVSKLVSKYQDAGAPNVTIEVDDANGDPRDLSGLTLRVVARTVADPPVGLWQIEAADITVGGADNDQATIDYDESHTADTGTYRWELWDIGDGTDDELIAAGPLEIRGAMKDTS